MRKERPKTISEPDLKNAIDQALKLRGTRIPVTEDEIKLAEDELQEIAVEIPESFRDPLAFLDSRYERKVVTFNVLEIAEAEAPIADELARAAREGGDIPQHIQDKMRLDRQAAERKKADKDSTR